MKIGVDICEVKRFKEKSIKFYEKIFKNDEILYAKKYKNYAEHFAGFFCAKEAIMKAIGVGIDKINVKDIEILHLKSGKAVVNLSGNAKKIFNSLNEKQIEISISHTKEFAVAFAIIY